MAVTQIDDSISGYPKIIEWRSRVKQALVYSILVLMGGGKAFSQNQKKDFGFLPATKFTIEKNRAVLKQLPFENIEDFENSDRGFIAAAPKQISGANGVLSWDLGAYDFLDEKSAPATVNPSLWRQAQLNKRAGLYKVTDGFYQIRGMDIANMNIIEGDQGLIVMDPLVVPETAKAGLELYFQHRPNRPVHTIIYTHSHVDHYGGVKGIVSDADVKNGKVRIIAPEGFLNEAVSENVFAGNAMTRRSFFMYGQILPKGPSGQVDSGLGKTAALGSSGLINPTDTIAKTGEKRTIDGIDMVFQMAQDTEAPSEFLVYFPKQKALCTSEVATHTLHNFYTLRGAKTRDSKNWWKTLNETIELFGSEAEVVFAQHHWPIWGKEKVVDYLTKQRDMIKFIHDQSLNLANKGYTMSEIGEMVKLPEGLDKEWYNRGYYGSVSHNARGVYNKYLGYYSSNPSELNPLPRREAAVKYVEFMGGANKVLAQAQKSFDKGEYRWVAQVVNHVVFADPSNKQARELQAKALEQLGYQMENPTWRNEYLMGAFELRHGVPDFKNMNIMGPDTLSAMSTDLIWDYMGIRINAQKAVGITSKINFSFPDRQEKFGVNLNNSVLTYSARNQHSGPDASVTMSRNDLNRILSGDLTINQGIKEGSIKVEGSLAKVRQLGEVMDQFPLMFNIVTPVEEAGVGKLIQAQEAN
jgi:alkyl sulfatase BDS1-like metallo-beta-lactamase superfamily hydrolase